MKARTKKAGRPAKRGFNSITALMKDLFQKDLEMGYAGAAKTVKGIFPKSRFNEKHFSWYKCAFKRGALKGVR